MNKTETNALWRALCACTCKPGVNARHSIAYMDRARTFNAILDYDPDDRDFSGMPPYYDPACIALAMRPHRALGSKNMQFHHGKGSKRIAPLIITSTIETSRDPIIITSAVQGMRSR